MTGSDLRQRKPLVAAPSVSSSDSEPESQPEVKPVVKKRRNITTEDDYTPWVDVLRVLSFLVFAACGLSYLISGGESFFFGMRNKPYYLRPDWWKSQFRGPLYLTPEELAMYDGSDPSKPLYLAINGTIYDVSVSPHIYGPDGSYKYFGGCDASRGYVTGCFAADRTPDMRGVEEIFLPIDDPAVDAHWTPEELAEMKEKELREAKEKVHTALKHWVDFFASSEKYHHVGYVVREKDWLEKEEKRTLCDAAVRGRKKRKIPK